MLNTYSYIAYPVGEKENNNKRYDMFIFLAIVMQLSVGGAKAWM